MKRRQTVDAWGSVIVSLGIMMVSILTVAMVAHGTWYQGLCGIVL